MTKYNGQTKKRYRTNRFFAIVLCLIILSSLIPNTNIYAAETEEVENTAAENEIDYSAYWPSGPEINADAAIVVDASTGLILYAKDIYSTYYPASITKIMTTLVALENSSLNETITVSYEAEWYVSKTSSRMGLVEGEQLTMEEALYGVMLESANEGTYAVGEHVADGSIAKFIKMMNNKAAELGCTNTHYANTHGLHDDEHYTCCYDMALISMAAIRNPIFRKITGTATYEMPATNKNPERLLTNHHKFITKQSPYDYCIGGKTGATTQANYNLVTYAKKDGMTIISIVMHSDTWDTVYSDTKTLLDFTFDNYSHYNIEKTRLEGKSTFPALFTEAEPFKRNEDSIIRISEDGNIVLPNNVDYTEAVGSLSLFTPEELGHGDNLIGNISYTYGGRTVANADILFYNSENPITAEVFRNEWPEFMIPVDVAFPEVEVVSEGGEEPTGTVTEAAPSPTPTVAASEITGANEPVTLQPTPTKAADISGSSSAQTEKQNESYDYRPILLAAITFVVVMILGVILIFRKPKR